MEQEQTKPLATETKRFRLQEIEERLQQTSLTKEEEKQLAKEKFHLESDFDWFDIAFEENGKQGIKDVFGKVRVPAKFDSIDNRFSYLYRNSMKYYPVKLNGKYGIVKADGTGTPIVDFKYEHIRCCYLAHSYIAVLNNKLGMIDEEEHVLIPFEMDDIDKEMDFGVLTFKKEINGNEKYGFLTSYGVYVAPKFDEILIEPDECILVRVGEDWGYVREDNKEFVSKKDYNNLEDDVLWTTECY